MREEFYKSTKVAITTTGTLTVDLPSLRLKSSNNQAMQAYTRVLLVAALAQSH